MVAYGLAVLIYGSSGSNSAVSEWCAAAGSANTVIDRATRAANIIFIGISG